MKEEARVATTPFDIYECRGPAVHAHICHFLDVLDSPTEGIITTMSLITSVNKRRFRFGISCEG